MSEAVLLVGGLVAGVDIGAGWHATPCASPARALELLAEETEAVGAVVGLGLPGDEGVALLERLRTEFPDVARILVSGPAGLGVALRAADLAHQVLPMPCEAPTLVAALDRVMAGRRRLANEAVRSLASSAEGLPSPPRVFSDLTIVLESPTCSSAEIASVIRSDPAVSAKVLQLVNSSFFGLPREVAEVRDAVTLLGSAMIRSLVLSTSALSLFRAPAAEAGINLESMQARAVSTAALAAELAPRGSGADAFTAGLLSDAGVLLLAAKAPALLVQPEAEWGFTHAAVGAFLLGLWGLPAVVVEAVAFHHTPADLPHHRYEVVDAVHLAGYLVAQSTLPPDAAAYLAGLDGLTDAASEYLRAVASPA
jgi:HD-like signal output (HDOD) protein